ncbi:HEAT repeat domain-containing protein [Citrobacter sp. Cpa228]|uniref:HEAT repeat domain-containing protein n=1 Tax=Citrobacter sp. Cpa228 TaxID=2985119 RepID=UPI0025777010|nr:HEAT repeat domain-containing protein [Citrobacter sp. Cpa228]MDM2925636.1 hypothetical protein [Citrobacter sp. Cpa228]
MLSEIVDRLITLTRDRDPSVVIAAALALGEGAPDTSDVVECLMSLTENYEPSIKSAGATALGRLYRRRR